MGVVHGLGQTLTNHEKFLWVLTMQIKAKGFYPITIEISRQFPTSIFNVSVTDRVIFRKHDFEKGYFYCEVNGIKIPSLQICVTLYFLTKRKIVNNLPKVEMNEVKIQ